MEEKNYLKKIYFVLLFLTLVLTGFLCKQLSSVILPVITAFFLSFVFLPVLKAIRNKLKIPWSVSSILLVVVMFFVLLGISTLLVSSLSTIAYEYPKYESKFMNIYKMIASRFHLEIIEGDSFVENIWQFLQVREIFQKVVVSFSSGAISFSKTLLTIFLLLAFLLLEINYSNDKIKTAFDDQTKIKVHVILNNIVNDVVKFISIKFLISLITGIIVYLITVILGLDFPIVWAFIALIMNFIPIFGSFISVGITTIFAMIQFYPESIYKIIIIFTLMIVLNFVLGNIIEPRMEGKQLGLSPFVILVSLSIWGYIWGFAGMIYAVPLMVIIKIVCENIDYLYPIAVFLGNNKEETK